MAARPHTQRETPRANKHPQGKSRVEQLTETKVTAPIWRAQFAADALRPEDIPQLQRTIGNRATERLLQAKLKLGPAGDTYEQEADQVARQVVRAIRRPQVQREEKKEGTHQSSRYADSIPTPERDSAPPSVTGFITPPPLQKIQREETNEELMQAKPLAADISQVRRTFVPPPPNFMKKVQREEMDEELQASANHGMEGGDVDTDVARSIESAKGGGQPLNDGIRSSMEGAFGADFSRVNVHTGTKADELNRSLNAKAFTTGNDIFFGQGQYNPGSTGGQELIAHELTHTVQQGAAGVQRQPYARPNVFRSDPSQLGVQRLSQFHGMIQRAPDLVRLRDKLGQRKFTKVSSAGQTEYFHELTDDQLLRYRGMQNTVFDELVESLKESLLSNLAGKTADIAQVADLLGAAVETGEDAAQVAAVLPMLMNTMSGAVSARGDVAMEGFGGGIGGIKDTLEGGSSIVKQQKYVEGGLTTLSGISGIVSLIPGVPDAVGMAGAGAKSVAGMAKIANTRINQNAIDKLKIDGATNPSLVAALDVLANKLGYWEGAQQTLLGAVEGTGAFFGGVGKWGTSLFSKGVETLPGLLQYTGRAIGSTVTSAIDSNATVSEREESEKTEEKRKMRAAVESVETGGLAEHIGRLHRLVVLIEPDYADELDRSVTLLPNGMRQDVKAAIKLKATWNPS